MMEQTRKIGFYDPYLDTLGGGERYTLTLAEHLLRNGWKVDLFWEDPSIKERLQDRLNLDLRGMNFLRYPKGLIGKWQKTKEYDAFFWVSDGSIPLLFTKNNLLHFQVPFHDVGGRNVLNKLKLGRIDTFVCNSYFTKGFIDKEFNLDSKVIYPPVETSQFKPGKKENIILSVGRFSQLLQAKNQKLLVETFTRLIDEGLRDWRLILAGGTEVGGAEYLSLLKEKAKGYPVEFFDSPSFEVIKDLYSRAKIFWYAAGFGVDEVIEPERVEHFGITPVEAIAAGCIPVVVKKGGLKEIITNGKNGFFWQTEEELIGITRKIIQEKETYKRMKNEMVKLGDRFSKERFRREFDEILD